jgi:hypothetical protein
MNDPQLCYIGMSLQQGDTAADLARKNGHTGLCKTLRDYMAPLPVPLPGLPLPSSLATAYQPPTPTATWNGPSPLPNCNIAMSPSEHAFQVAPVMHVTADPLSLRTISSVEGLCNTHLPVSLGTPGILFTRGRSSSMYPQLPEGAPVYM